MPDSTGQPGPTDPSALGRHDPRQHEAGLHGECVLVTGAGRRVGRSIALELARSGADVAVHVNRSVAEGEEVAHAVEALGRRATVVVADQRDVDAIGTAVHTAEATLGPLTGLVNSAALWPHAELETLTQEDFDLALEVNLRGPFFFAREIGCAMKRRGHGAVISIADVAYDRPWPDSLPYCMAKAGIVSMTYGLARALAPEVRVNAIGPGPILFPPDYPAELAQRDRAATLRGREGEPLDIARTVVFLLQSPNITGTFLPVDGGYRFGI